MLIPVVAVFLAVIASCLAEGQSEMQQIEELISDDILDEIADNDESPDVSAAVRYMIPVPIRVVVPVPQPMRPAYPPPYPPPYPEGERYPPERERYPSEREPIVALPIGLTPGRYGQRRSWKPIGPPVIAVPVGSATRYPLPDRDDDYERRALASSERIQAEDMVRKTRSIKEEFMAEGDAEELTSSTSLKAVAVIQRGENPLKVSTKSHRKGFKSSNQKRFRPKRQLDTFAVQRGGFVRSARVFDPADPQPVVIAPESAPRTQVVPVPVNVPVRA